MMLKKIAIPMRTSGITQTFMANEHIHHAMYVNLHNEIHLVVHANAHNFIKKN